MPARQVRFLRNSDNYLLAVVDNYLKFIPADSESGPNAKFEIMDAGQSRVRIRCIGNENYWKLDRTTNWIKVEKVEISTTDSLFVSAIDALSYTAYQNVGNGMYCKTFTAGTVQDCIMASASELSDAVKLIIVDV